MSYLNDTPENAQVLLEHCGSQSLQEAQASVQTLTALVQEVLNTNQEIARRLAMLETRSLPCSAPKLEEDSFVAVGDTESSTCTHSVHHEASSIRGRTGKESYGAFAFDGELKTTRVYTRAIRRMASRSLSRSARHSFGWSMLSGATLAEISNISVMSLPIAPRDLWNSHHYSATEMAANSLSGLSRISFLGQ